jgi:predicted peroxiredoxin
MPKILVHITRGPDDPTTAALGFLVAKTAASQGHHVSVFLAGEAVHLFTANGMEVEGLGTGKVGDHYQAIAAAGVRFYLSGMSSKARGIGEDDIAGKPAEFAMPDVLVSLATEANTVFTY